MEGHGMKGEKRETQKGRGRRKRVEKGGEGQK